MTTEQTELTITVTGASPGLVGALRCAAEIAAEHGHNWVGADALLVALLEPMSATQVCWQLQHPGEPLTFDQVHELAKSMIPAAPISPAYRRTEPAQVTYELSGPDADKFEAAIRQAENHDQPEPDLNHLEVVDPTKLGDDDEPAS